MGHVASWPPLSSSKETMVSQDIGADFDARRERIRIIGGAALRTGLGIAFLLLVFMLIPARLQASLLLFLIAVLGVIALYTWHFRLQFRRIRKATYPGIQATEALLLTGALFLTTFAAFYVVLSGENPEAFNTNVTHLSALYFTVTVFATVGFGDIVAVSDLARTLVTIQMLLGLGFLAVIAKVFFGYVRRVREERQNDQPDS
jgi:voltage-gated potassium channel